MTLKTPMSLQNVQIVLLNPDNSSQHRTYVVKCKCGEEYLRLLGYSLQSQSLPTDTVFIGPLDVECPQCGEVNQIFDPEFHGYNGEIASNTTLRGEGPKEAWQCPACGCQESAIQIRLGYTIDLDEEMEVRREDFFNSFELSNECRNCHSEANVTEFDCI